LAKLDKNNQYVLLLRKKYFDELKFPSNFKKILTDFRHYSFIEQIKLPIIIYREKADLVHFPHFNVPVFYFGKFVVTVHDLLMHKFKDGAVTTLPRPFYFIRRLGYNLSFWKVMNFAKVILVPTKAIKKDIVNHYKINPDRIKITYEGYTPKKKTKKLSTKKVLTKFGLVNKKYFFYVGNAYPHKNLEGAMRALLELGKDSCNLVIAGSRDVFKDKLIKYAKSLGILGKVKILGYVTDTELSILYKNSIAFIYPSFEEGFGLQGLESFANGTMLGASDIAVFNEVYGNNALYFDPHDIKSIAKVMKEMMGISSKKREQIIKRAKKHLKKYSWDKMVKQTLDIYDGATK